jgi:hypothetical protein
MKCVRQPKFLLGKTVQIANLIEVHLAVEQWRTIVKLAGKRGWTFSMMTRFCVLRLATKTRIEWTARLREAHEEAKLRISIARAEGGVHRHMLCLYGDDEKIIRVAAMDLGITMSAFIRLALELYLHLLAMEKHSKWYVTDAHLVENSIRLVQQLTIFAAKAGPFPLLHELNSWHWELETYW